MTLNTRLWSNLSDCVFAWMEKRRIGKWGYLFHSQFALSREERTQTHVSELNRPPVVQALLQADCCILNSCCNAKAALKPHPETLLVLTTSFKSDRITYFSTTLGISLAQQKPQRKVTTWAGVRKTFPKSLWPYCPWPPSASATWGAQTVVNRKGKGQCCHHTSTTWSSSWKIEIILCDLGN